MNEALLPEYADDVKLDTVWYTEKSRFLWTYFAEKGLKPPRPADLKLHPNPLSQLWFINKDRNKGFLAALSYPLTRINIPVRRVYSVLNPNEKRSPEQIILVK